MKKFGFVPSPVFRRLPVPPRFAVGTPPEGGTQNISKIILSNHLSQIEHGILSLPVDEHLFLISRVAAKLRGKVETESSFESQLTEMANDENIQRELKEIESDFRCA